MPQRLKITEAIAFGIISFSFQQRRDQRWDVHRGHLVVAVDLDDHLRAKFERFSEPGQHGPTYPLIFLVSQQDDAPVTVCKGFHQC